MPSMNAASELTLKTPAYKKAVDLYVWQTYLQDLAEGDITTKSFVKKRRQTVKAQITASEPGMLAGIQEAEWFLEKAGIEIVQQNRDGILLKPGDIILEIESSAEKILAAERTLLNLLQRMSGIATATKKLTLKLPKNIKLLATRKTFWGLLDKRAVVVGGGHSHRLSLSDAILIKDNHIALVDDFKKALKRSFKKAKKVRFIDVELESMEQVESFLEIFKTLKIDNPTAHKIVVMLDNFKPAEIKKILPLFQELNLAIEVSGGITTTNIKRYAIKGVSFISSSTITGKAGTLDMSLSF